MPTTGTLCSGFSYPRHVTAPGPEKRSPPPPMDATSGQLETPPRFEVIKMAALEVARGGCKLEDLRVLRCLLSKRGLVAIDLG